MRVTKQCYNCKQQFRKEELVDYASINSTTLHSYCPTCLKEKQDRDLFSQSVCQIFGLKRPGPQIWTERKRLINTYGYTDDIIIKCLDYIYNVKKYKKFSDSLCLVKPPMVEEMLKYRRSQENKNVGLIAAIKNAPEKNYIVPIKENSEKKKEWNPDDWLEDD